MRIATSCERCGSPVTESGVWVVASGVRIYCRICGYLSGLTGLSNGPALDAVPAGERGVATVVALRSARAGTAG